MLDDSDRATLLSLARKTLETYFKDETIPPFETDRPGLLDRKGAFVTLHTGGELRGCIGQLEPDRELFNVVQHCALSAAFADTRFIPLQEQELNGLDIEISVLTPFRRVEDTNEITVGKHGLFIAREHCRGLLLPQVAEEYRWDRKTFLEQTCVKAGLPSSAWTDPRTEIFVFEAEVFSEPQRS